MEILISLTVMGVAGLAIMLAFATSISGSGQHRNLVTLDTVLRTASAQASSALQQQPPTAFSNCQAAYNLNPPNGPSPFSLPTGYTATVQSVQYWNGAAWTGSQSPPQNSCPSGVTTATLSSESGIQQLTIAVTHSGQTYTTTVVTSNPTAPAGGGSCTHNGSPTTATQLVWLSQPGNALAGQALFPVPSVVLEDQYGCVEQNDASQVTLAITTGTGAVGATLNGCTAQLGYGQTSFYNCSISMIGSGYTLTASDPTDLLTGSKAAVSSPFNVTAGVPVQLAFTANGKPSGQPGNGLGGAALIQQPTVYIEDAAGNVVTGDTSTVVLAIGTNPGGGTLSGCTSQTVNGVATFSGCKIDKVGTGYTLTATDVADNLTTPSSPSTPFNVTVGPPAQLAFTTPPGTTVAGDPLSPQPAVAIEDAGGNITSSTGAVSLSIGTNPAAGILSGCSATTSAGLASFSGCSINNVGLGYTLVAKSGSLAAATSPAFNIVAPALTSFRVVPATSSPTAGTAFNVTITALDQSGYTFPTFTGTQTIAFSGPSNAPNGTAPVYPATVNFTNGVGTASITLYDAETTSVTATQGTVTGSSGSVTVGAKSTTVALVLSNPGNQVAGTAFIETVSAVDQFGNTTTSYSGSKAVTFSGPSSSPSGNAPSYPGSVTFTSGVGTPSITLYDAQSTTLTATQGTVTGTSGSFTVNPAGVSSFNLSNPGTQNAGSSFSVTVTALDNWGNQATSYGGVQALTFSGPLNSPKGNAPLYPGSVSFTSGVGTASMTLYNAASTTLTVTQGSVTDSTPPTFTISPLAANAFTLSTPSPTAGTAFNETVTAIDTYGNQATSYTGSKSLTFSGPANAPSGTAPLYPATVTFSASGIGTASITLYAAQTTTLTATQSLLTGTSASFTVSGAATANRFTVANPGTQTAGNAFSVTITAIDTWGNTANGYSGSKAVTFSGPSSSPSGNAPSYPGSVTFTSGVGTPSITLYDAQSTTLTATQGTSSGTTTSFSVQAGPQASLYLTNITHQPTPPVTPCSGPVSGLTTCISTGEGSLSGSSSARTLTAGLQLVDNYGNVVTNNTGSSISITLLSSPDVQSPPPPSPLTVASGQSSTSSNFTLIRKSGSNKSAVLTAIVGTTADLQVTLQS